MKTRQMPQTPNFQTKHLVYYKFQSSCLGYEVKEKTNFPQRISMQTLSQLNWLRHDTHAPRLYYNSSDEYEWDAKRCKLTSSFLTLYIKSYLFSFLLATIPMRFGWPDVLMMMMLRRLKMKMCPKKDPCKQLCQYEVLICHFPFHVDSVL